MGGVVKLIHNRKDSETKFEKIEIKIKGNSK